jgi:hypothetical protein
MEAVMSEQALHWAQHVVELARADTASAIAP